MHFLARDEARVLEKKLRRQIADQARPKVILYYNSGGRDCSIAANAVTASIGRFTEATLIFLFSVSGDGWMKIWRGMSDGAGTDSGDAHTARAAGCMRGPDISSGLMRLNTCRKQ